LERYEEAAAAFRRATVLNPDFARAQNDLGLALRELGQHAEAETAYRRAIALERDYAEALNNLGALLCDKQGKPVEAEVLFRRVIKLKPNLAVVHNNLGQALRNQGRHAEAEKAYREAIALTSDYGEAYYNLAFALSQQKKHSEAEAVLRQAVARNPEYAQGQYSLGALLYTQGRLSEAEPYCRRAVELQPGNAEALCNLGQVLRRLGRVSEAIPVLRRGHELGTKLPSWNYPSDQWLRYAERLVELDAKLPAVLAGEARPADAAEQLAFAQLCQQYKKLNAAAARFFIDAFAAEPKLAADLQAGHRYNAACSASLAGCGEGTPDDGERARLRRKALDWLTADLAAWAKLAVLPAERAKVRQTMTHWQQDADLAGVRGDATLAKLPEAERAAWQKLWADVAELRKRTEDPKPAGDSAPTP
jgi:tetratricopeptide (TPR) repeat protein